MIVYLVWDMRYERRLLCVASSAEIAVNSVVAQDKPEEFHIQPVEQDKNLF